MSEEDPINRPVHYNSHPSGIECITITQHHDFCVGNVIKYCWRAGLKGSESELKDLRKAAWYLARKIKQLEEDVPRRFTGPAPHCPACDLPAVFRQKNDTDGAWFCGSIDCYRGEL